MYSQNEEARFMIRFAFTIRFRRRFVVRYDDRLSYDNLYT